MKATRLLILGTALAAGTGAAVMVATSRSPEPAKPTVVRARVPTAEVLVAGKDLGLGAVIQDGDLRWQSWPKANVPPNVIEKSKMPRALADFKGAFVRSFLGAGEPVHRDWLIKAGNASFMAAMLPSGMRAVAINIDQQGSTTAGGFILPNDHVDVIHTYRDEEAAKAGVADPMVTETLLRNVKVLAIGQNIQERNNERVIVGSNATLELTPQQVETIILAQRVGQLSLALRSMTDSKATEPETVPKPPPAPPPPPPPAMTIVRYGVPIQIRSR